MYCYIQRLREHKCIDLGMERAGVLRLKGRKVCSCMRRMKVRLQLPLYSSYMFQTKFFNVVSLDKAEIFKGYFDELVGSIHM